MRLALALLAVCALAAGCGGTRHETVRITFGAASLTPDSEDVDHVIADRGWSLDAPVHVAGRRCGSPVTRAKEMFDGRQVAVDRPQPGDVEAEGYAGEVIEAHVTVNCKGTTASATHAYTLPRLRCEGGPLPVVELRGAATMEDDSRDGLPHALRVGDLLGTSTSVDVRGQAVVAAPACNGFNATLSAGTSGVGSYDAYGRGKSFVSSHLVLTGDRHAGSVIVLGKVTASTEDAPCPHCAPPLPPSKLEVLGRGTHAVIRADDGAVLVTGAGPSIRLVANEEVRVACGATCTASRPALVQPGEPLTLVPRHTSPLVPQYADITSRARIPSSAGEPAELALAWRRVHLASAASDGVQQEGVVIWAGHRKAYEYRASGYDTNFAVTSGDVTHDGHDDVIVAVGNDGSANCRVYRVVAATGGRIRTVFVSGSVCEAGSVSARDGNLLVTVPVDSCPTGGAHCYLGLRTETLRWDGRRFRRVRVATRCVRPGGSTTRAATRPPGSRCAR